MITLKRPVGGKHQHYLEQNVVVEEIHPHQVVSIETSISFILIVPYPDTVTQPIPLNVHQRPPGCFIALHINISWLIFAIAIEDLLNYTITKC